MNSNETESLIDRYKGAPDLDGFMGFACDAAPKKPQTLAQHLKHYHKGKMPKGDCSWLKQYKKDHPDWEKEAAKFGGGKPKVTKKESAVDTVQKTRIGKVKGGTTVMHTVTGKQTDILGENTPATVITVPSSSKQAAKIAEENGRDPKKCLLSNFPGKGERELESLYIDLVARPSGWDKNAPGLKDWLAMEQGTFLKDWLAEGKKIKKRRDAIHKAVSDFLKNPDNEYKNMAHSLVYDRQTAWLEKLSKAKIDWEAAYEAEGRGNLGRNQHMVLWEVNRKYGDTDIGKEIVNNIIGQMSDAELGETAKGNNSLGEMAKEEQLRRSGKGDEKSAIDKIKPFNEDHKNLLEFYKKHCHETGKGSLSDKSERSPYESSSTRAFFESRYQRVHGQPPPDGWQDNIEEVLKTPPPKDLPTVEQMDDFIEKFGHDQSREDREKNGQDYFSKTSWGDRFASIFPQYSDKGSHQNWRYRTAGISPRSGKTLYTDANNCGEKAKEHPVYKFLKRVYGN